MPGLLETLFGPDGIGGQPGVAGKVAQNGILNTVLGGVGKAVAPVGNAVAGGLGDYVADVATKNPVEILKNPMSVLNDRGQISITRLLFPEFRRAKVQEGEMAAKIQNAALSAEIMGTYGKLYDAASKVPMEQRSGIFNAAEAAGVDSDTINQVAGSVSQEDQRKQRTAEVLAPSLSGFKQGSQIATMLTGTPDEQEAAKLIVQMEQAKSRDAAIARRADARAAAANAPKPTDVEKKYAAYQTALQGGDPALIAATRAALEGVGKSSMPMVVTRPDGSTVVGPASEVQGFESTTARDRAIATIDSNDALLDTISEMRALADRSPESFGAAGSVGGFAQNLSEQGKAFAAMQDRVRADIAAGGAEPEVGVAVAGSFNKDIPKRVSLEMTLAYAKARANNPDGKISDSDFNAALATVRGGKEGSDWLSNAQSTKAVLEVLEREAKRDKNRAVLRARKGGKEKSPLSAALDAAEEKRGLRRPEPKPKKKFGNRDAAPGTTVGGKIPDSELRLLRDGKSLEALSEKDFRRWQRLNGESDGE